MDSVVYKFKFDIDTKVMITALKRDGRIKTIWITEKGIQYQVRYFDNAKALTVYFFEDEIKLLNCN